MSRIFVPGLPVDVAGYCLGAVGKSVPNRMSEHGGGIIKSLIRDALCGCGASLKVMINRRQ